MRNLLVSRLCGTKSELATCQDLAVAHRLVSRLESIPKRIGRERHNLDILTYNETSREKNWQMATDMYESMKDAEPNRAHLAIAELEQLGKLDCLITQSSS